MSPRPTPFDPASLGDPVARSTQWTPCKGGGSSFRSHVLVERGPTRVVFRPSLHAVLLLAPFFLIGCCMLGDALWSALSAALSGQLSAVLWERGDEAGVVPLFFMGLLFGGAGGALLWFLTRPVTFDRTRGVFWKGWSTPRDGEDACVQLASVHALQVISEYCGGKTRYFSYELNVVHANGQRTNVVDHGDLARVRRDAASLARFLGVPLWDPEA